jgi:hypothetical protein
MPETRQALLRLLFLFEPNPAALKDLAAVRLSDTAVWPKEAHQPNPGYLDELLPPVAHFLFGQENMGFAYRQANPILNDHLRDLHVEPNLNFGLAPNHRAELWMGAQGVAVLSLALEPKGGSLQDLQQLLYRLSELGRHQQATIQRPKSDHPEAPTPPSTSDPIQTRIGHRGGAFTLPELIEFLLPGLVQSQRTGRLHHFVTVRFDQTVTFPDSHDLDRPLFGIAQGEEQGHAGYAPGIASPAAENLNTKHRAANSTYGAVHFVADQGGHAFDEERLNRIATKYFAIYLTTLLQRSLFERKREEAAKLVSRAGPLGRLGFDRIHNLAEPLDRLQLELAQTTASELFSLASSRDVLQRYYALCQRSNLVEDARNDAQRSIADLHGLLREAQSLGTLRELAALNHIAHRFELVILGVYAIEAAHILFEPARDRHWLELGFFLALGLSGVFLGLTLQRMRHRGHHGDDSRGAKNFGALATLLLVLGLLLAVLAAVLTARSTG